MNEDDYCSKINLENIIIIKYNKKNQWKVNYQYTIITDTITGAKKICESVKKER